MVWHVKCSKLSKVKSNQIKRSKIKQSEYPNHSFISGAEYMDISREKPKKSHIKRYWPWILVILTVSAALHYLWLLAQADFAISKDTLVYDEVKRGEFTVSVRGSGLLVADNIQWLSANVEATVKRIVIKAGKSVKKGDLIVELSNPQLVQLLKETQWELEARIAESKANQVKQESELLDQESELLNAKLNFESSKLKQDAQTQLYLKSTGAVSKLDYEKTRLETIQLKQRWKIQQQRLVKMQENITAQNDARAARLNKMRKILERAQQQVNSLMIVATMDSVVQAVPIEPGQRLIMGSNIAKLAQQDSLIAELQIPELQIQDIAIGQKVLIDTRNNKVEGIVNRIDPAVVNGNVQVDVKFAKALPKEARPDLSIDGEIIVSDISNTFYVNRPIFAQSQSTTSLYKLSEDGNFAERVSVKLGQGSMNQIQIIEGLALGDKIITSDPSRWQTYQKIRIN